MRVSVITFVFVKNAFFVCLEIFDFSERFRNPLMSLQKS
ncbi:hypothetical protein PKB_4415 [Pseudomonas knackmussii B13]|uniref:Uncharacterized protein n=1 Tax=Pseudomonas knackmussii (strain DSM 6978 / CCUG 54928 / LMG 23759 / B13) TaxID=1301098 RepID=A0A024HL13_PSEKB|nr:hypothetical protein PKB_4415 [Pseudomonas knackmussii B13]